MNIVDVGGSGIKAVSYSIDSPEGLRYQSLFESAHSSIPQNNRKYSNSELAELTRQILKARESLESKQGETFFLATAGLRLSENSNTLIDRLSKYGISLKIVSPEEEAQFIQAAASYYISAKSDLNTEGLMLVSKTGGGSTEQILYLDGNVQSTSSNPLGVIAMQRAMGQSKFSFVVDQLNAVESMTERSLNYAPSNSLIFCGRIMKRIGKAIYQAKNHEFDYNNLNYINITELKSLIAVLETGKDSQILKQYGINPQSKHKYLAGALVMQTVLNASSNLVALIAPVSMRDGFALQLLSQEYGAERLTVASR